MDSSKIKLNGNKYVLESNRITISPRLLTGTKVIADRTRQEIRIQHLVFGLKFFGETLIPFSEVAFVTGKATTLTFPQTYIEHQEMIDILKGLKTEHSDTLGYQYEVFVTLKNGSAISIATITQDSSFHPMLRHSYHHMDINEAGIANAAKLQQKKTIYFAIDLEQQLREIIGLPENDHS